MTTDPPERPYVLGHSPRELDRLDLQGEFYRDITQRTLVQAGLRPGMHVLDMGCGTGDVSMLCAEMIGPTGVVVGVDREEAAVLSGRARALERRAHNVTLEVGEVVTQARLFPAGTYVVPTAQSLGRLVAHMLEVETRDNVVFWNTMDAWIPRSEVVPIFKLMTPAALSTRALGS